MKNRSKGFPFSTLTIAIGAIVGSSHLAAQTQESMETVVVTAAGHEQLAAKAPASISVLSRDDLDSGYYRDVTDALRRVPGVTVTNGGDDPDISIRGMGAAYSLILVNGKRQSSRETRPNSDGPGIEQGWLPPIEAIDRIEIIRGPMSTLYGSDAIGGVINIITRTNQQEWSGNVQIGQTIQENRKSGNEQTANVYVSGPLTEKLSLAVTGQTANRDEDEILNGYQDRSLNSIGSTLTYDINDDHQVSFDVGYSKQDRSSTPGKVLAIGEEPDLDEYDRTYYSLDYQGEVGVLGTLNAYVQYEDSQNHSRKIYNTNTRFKTTLVTPIANHTLLSGFEYNYANLEDETTNTGGTLTKLSNSGYAFFLEDEWAMVDSFSLTMGARLDNDKTYGSHVSPRLYGVWSLDDSWTLKGGVSTGYKAPSLRQTSPDWVQVSRGGNIYGNPDLKPESSITTEIGLNYQGESGFNSSLTLFNNEFKDKVTRIVCESCGPVNSSGNAATTRINVDEAVTRGVELTLSTPIGENWYWTNSYTFTDSEQKTGKYKGDPLVQLPKHEFSSDLSWQATQDLEVWGSVTYRGKEMQPIAAPSQSNLVAPSYTFVDMGVSYQLTDDMKLNAAVYNLLDKEVGYDEYGYVEDGRRYWLGLDIGF